ncbi:MAG: transcriptional regulator [Candidatus Sericytochromatia bacterium]|nr:transcriptional regulator [Candidatus Sericytochromatia bacterium]
MDLQACQQDVDAWIKDHGGYWDEFVTLARMSEELGEVSAALQRLRGFRPRKVDVDLGGEVGDLLFVLCSFANQQGLSLDACFTQVMAKITARDSQAWKDKQA